MRREVCVPVARCGAFAGPEDVPVRTRFHSGIKTQQYQAHEELRQVLAFLYGPYGNILRPGKGPAARHRPTVSVEGAMSR